MAGICSGLRIHVRRRGALGRIRFFSIDGVGIMRTGERVATV